MASKALAVARPLVHKQQAVAMFLAGGTLSRARELIAVLWGEEAVPDDAELQVWIADEENEPTKEQVQMADRLSHAQYKGKLVEARDTALSKMVEKMDDPKTSAFNLNGMFIAIGNQLMPIMDKKPATVNLQGAQFITKYDNETPKPKRKAKPKQAEAIEGQFREVMGEQTD